APNVAADDVLHEVATWLEGEERADRILLDAYHPGAYGGSGVVGNWGVAATVARRFPIILAGGLTPENVGEAIDQVQPFGVDVSSGIETDGAKDPVRIASFMRAARSRAGSPAARTA
ncbi:MAG: phosphoribosylanthranilate isomerase, partial [Thermomicrobiales bacterium]